MPKIIENPEARLMEEARRQVETAGYAAMTIRSVAKECGMGVGTVYNYFSSKDELLAKCMLEDWNRCIAAIRETGSRARSPEPVVRCIYDQLRDYSRHHSALFGDEAARGVFALSFGRYHSLLRRQLAEPLGPFCGDGFAAEFIAEALLTWTMAGKEYDRIYAMIEKLFE